MKTPLFRSVPLVLLAFFAYFGPSASARTFYVAPGGRDDTEATLGEPLGRPERAVRFAKAGDKIVLRGGVYDLQSSVYIDKAGVSLVNYPGEKPVLRAPVDESSPVVSMVVVVASRVLVSGIEVRGASYYGIKIDVDERKNPPRGVIIRNCRVGGTGRDCFKTFNADDLLIESCDIGPSGLRDDTNAEGIDSLGSHGVTVRNCRLHDIATAGICFKAGATDGLVEGCVIKNAKRSSGILLGQDTDAEFMRDGTPFEARRCVARNNIISNTSGSGVGTYAGESIRFENNTLVDVARETGAGVWVGVNRRGVGARGVSFTNNIVVQSGVRPFAYLLEMQGSFSAANNLYFSTGRPGYFRIERQKNVQTLALGAWRAATGSDGNSRIANPHLDAAKGFVLRAGSPALRRGARLPGLTRDFSGKARRTKGNVDIGARGN